MLKTLTALPKLLLTILLSAMLTACATHEPPRIVSDVSCSAFSVISYAQLPRTERDKPRDDQADPGNRADTPETVAEVQAHNARFEAICRIASE